MSYAVLFPGQGSQFVGMGSDVFDARPDLLGDGADDILGWSLRRVCLEGPEAELTQTDKAQPALYAVSYALWEAFREAAAAPPDAAAGHSLGEYTALAAAGVFTYEEGLGLVAARGEAMERAARAEASGMAALLGADEETAQRVATRRREEGGRLWVANVNAPGQIVLAGAKEDISWLEEHGRELGVRRVVPLKVAGAFHCPLMKAAAEDLAVALETVPMGAPEFPVWANVSASQGEDFAPLLEAQLTGTVRFADSLQAMGTAGIDAFVHIGPGDVTAAMARRSVPDADVHVVSSLEQIPAVVGALNVQ